MIDAHGHIATHTRDDVTATAGINRLMESLEYSPETGVFTWMQSQRS